MSFLSELFAAIGSFALTTIQTFGYGGIFFLMMLESMVVPVPSELVMPFAGFLIEKGSFTFPLIILASTLGSITGSLIFYYVGKTGGHALVEKYGKYVLINHDDVRKTEEWFHRRGELTVFFARLVPVIRHLISLIAGIGKMEIKRFTLYTIIGAALWNTILAYLGYMLGQHWEEVNRYTDLISYVIVILIIVFIIYFVYRHLKKRKTFTPS
ncbi:MAG TPA: DedA family protein [Candidatus Thermoplasmatota archaeon]|nr:DedA family protein [Candidatus Thermoplasmatota archaeon]